MGDSPRASLRRAARAAFLALSIPPGVAGLTLHQAFIGPQHHSRARERWLARWSHLLLRLFAVRIDLLGEPVPPPLSDGRGRLVVANHRSAIDIGLLFALFAPRMVSRADLGGWPILGWGARRIGTLFVDRRSVQSGASVIRQMRDALGAGDTVGLFPEGTTFPDDVVRPFRTASFATARTAGAEIVPIGIAYATGAEANFGDETFLVHLGRIAAARETHVAVCIGAPLATTPGESAEAFTARAHATVQRLVHQARAHVDR